MRVGGRKRRGLAIAAAMVVAACSDGPTDPEDLDIEVISGSGQSSLVEWALEEPLLVRVIDLSGEPMSGVRVRFAPSVGGGRASPSVVTTGTFGTASTDWTLGAMSGTQVIVVSVEDGTASKTAEATALGVHEADVLVVHGSMGPLAGFVLVREDEQGVDVLGFQRTPDTVLYVPPGDVPGKEIVVFGPGNRPLRVRPGWTSGVDTAHATMSPPVPVDIRFVVQAGNFEARRETMLQQVEHMESIWREEGLGLTVGELTFVEGELGGEVNVVSAGICDGRSVGTTIQVALVSSIDNGGFTGWGCRSGHVFLAFGTERFPNLLAHELGHTFTLGHTGTGMMAPNPPGREVREGEIFRAHFHQASSLNTIFASQPESQWRNCSIARGCLPEALDLGSGVVTLTAATTPAAALRAPGGTEPVDSVIRELPPGG